jgi:hypothetical protein
MNEYVKKMWVKALRSGKYKQTRGQLYNKLDNAFCCLGVLCDLHRKRKLKINKKKCWAVEEYHNTGESGCLPTVVRTWAGLKKVDPVVSHGHFNKHLSTINDSSRSFTEIADLIEKKL